MPRIKSSEELPNTKNILDRFPKKYNPVVGYKNIRVPLKNLGAANVTVTVDMTPDVKGANLNTIRTIVEDTFKETNQSSFLDILNSLLDNLKQNSSVKIDFEMFKTKKSPVDNVESIVDFKVSLEGSSLNGQKRSYYQVVIPYISVCPRSKEISDYGAHSQLSFATIKVELIDAAKLSPEDICDIVDKCGSASVYNILTGVDEAYITELMYENPFYPEDVIRKIGIFLDKELDKSIKDYIIEVNHNESIHTSIAVAKLNAGRELK